MKSQQNSKEITIKQDLEDLSHGIRLFHDNDDIAVNEITKNILKYAPTSIILRIQDIKGTALAHIVYLNKEMGILENLLSLAEKAIRIFSEVGTVEDIKKLREVLRD